MCSQRDVMCSQRDGMCSQRDVMCSQRDGISCHTLVTNVICFFFVLFFFVSRQEDVDSGIFEQ